MLTNKQCLIQNILLLLLNYLQEGKQRATPFLFATVKGYTGHQESAAGAVGLMEAIQVAQRAATAPALHLRHLNPHVHGALQGHSVAIARGGPSGVPCIVPDGRLVLGVSSFGAQGTNAHAIISGSGFSNTLPIRITTTSSDTTHNNNAVWRQSWCWVAPKAQALLTVAWATKRLLGRPSAVTFETNLAIPRLQYLWQYTVYRRPHLSSAAIVSMAASSSVLLAPDEKMSTAMTDVIMAIPQQLPAVGRGPAAASASISLVIRPGSGSLEVDYLQQKLLSAKFGSSRILSDKADSNPAINVLKQALVSSREPPVYPAIVPSTTSICCEPLDTTQDTSTNTYAIHPTVLNAVLIDPATKLLSHTPSPMTWLRTIQTIVLPPSSHNTTTGVVSQKHLVSSTTESEGWLMTNAALCSGGTLYNVAVFGAVVGEHDMPPMSPGPSVVTEGASGQGINNQGASGDENEVVVGADNPLLVMSEEERMLHLQAQVRENIYYYNSSSINV